ncbi:hypothetical protein [Deinococcus aluminii]
MVVITFAGEIGFQAATLVLEPLPGQEQVDAGREQQGAEEED